MAFELTQLQVFILTIIANINNYRLHAHNANNQLIKKNLSRNFNVNNILFKKWKKKGLKPLISQGLVIEHPTEGNSTYEISKMGLDLLNNL